jgi:hypothetical protein
MRALLTRKIQFEENKVQNQMFIDSIKFSSQFGLHLKKIKVQGFNYNLFKDLTTKFQNLSDQTENGHFTSQNSTVSKETVHHLLYYTREAISAGKRRNN